MEENPLILALQLGPMNCPKSSQLESEQKRNSIYALCPLGDMDELQWTST